MEIVRSKRAGKRQTRRAAAPGDRSTTERRRSSSTQTSYEYRARSSSTQTSYEYRARGGVHEEEGGGGDYEEEAEEQQHWQPGSLPSLAAHFAALTNAILKRIKEEGTRHKLYDEFMKECKEKLINDLKRTYNDLDYFYTNPSGMMPSCLSKSPPFETFFTSQMDMRLSSKELQIKQDLRAFVEELGFVCLRVQYIHSNVYTHFYVDLRLDVATVPTTEAQKVVENRLVALERVSQ